MSVELRDSGGGRGELRLERFADPVSEIVFHSFRNLVGRVVFAVSHLDAFPFKQRLRVASVEYGEFFVPDPVRNERFRLGKAFVRCGHGGDFRRNPSRKNRETGHGFGLGQREAGAHDTALAESRDDGFPYVVTVRDFFEESGEKAERSEGFLRIEFRAERREFDLEPRELSGSDGYGRAGGNYEEFGTELRT